MQWAQWSFHHCALSGEPLQPPIMACGMGLLYNRESVMEFVVGQGRFEFTKQELLPQFGHLTSLKRDVFLVHLTPIEEEKEEKEEENENDGAAMIGKKTTVRWKCPISHVPCNGKHPFGALPCGHVLSLSTIRELAGQECPICGVVYAEDDIVSLLTIEENVHARQEKRVQEHAAKRKRRSEAQEAIVKHVAEDSKANIHADEGKKAKKKRKRAAELPLALLALQQKGQADALKDRSKDWWKLGQKTAS